MNELLFLSQLKELLRDEAKGPDPLLDDCAAIAGSQSGLLVTTDMLVDGVHFCTANTPTTQIARKVVCANLSDLAASGGSCPLLLVSLAVPGEWSNDKALEFMKSIIAVSSEWNATIIGGDTNLTSGPLTVCITAIGKQHWRGAVTRSGAKPGDFIYVTGELGGSFTGGRHLTFTPRLQEAAWLLDHFPVSSMMDLSDGLATDARRLAEASKVQLLFQRDAIPLHSDTAGDQACRLKQAFCDGEDFELLFTIEPRLAQELQAQWPWPSRLGKIGRCSAEASPKLGFEDSGLITPILWKGYEHGSQ